MLFIEGCGVYKFAHLGNTNRAHRILDSVSLASLEHTNAKASNQIQICGGLVQLCVKNKRQKTEKVLLNKISGKDLYRRKANKN